MRADQPDLRQELTGVYSTYRGVKDQTFDYYYFGQTVYGPPQTPANPVDQQLNTFGSRWQGKRGKWLWEFEGGYQFGRYAAKSDSAGFAVAGAGRELPDAPWKPTVWTFYDWASGTANPRSRHASRISAASRPARRMPSKASGPCSLIVPSLRTVSVSATIWY